jgi:hypothetical protein
MTIALPHTPQTLPIRAAWMASKPTDVTLDSPPPPQIEIKKRYQRTVQNALAVIGVVCLFRHLIWNAQDVGRCTSCASSKYLVSNSLLFYISPNIHSLIAFLLLSSNSFLNKAKETTSLNQLTIHQQMSIKVA